MTKFQLLNAFLTKRLMVAVQEILEMVENTVSEYQEETARTKRENESLRWKLREVGLETEAAFCQGDALLASRGKRLTEQQCCEKEWSSSLRQQDPELTLTEEKQELIILDLLIMTKLQLLNSYLKERLMVAVQEILDVVKETVCEYQEENIRTKTENESLKRKLHEFVLKTDSSRRVPSFSTAGAQSTAQPASGGKCLTEQQCCEKEWSSSLRQQHPELTLTEEKQELSEEQSSTQREEESVLSLPCVKSDYSLEFISPNTYSMKTTETEEKGDFIEQQRTRLREEKNNGPDSGVVSRALVILHICWESGKLEKETGEDAQVHHCP
ncbi:hypothetical protein AGOR_G00093910 [Albula goreensis]|uniref:Uncharacterized protein n=1 Tax=Albula goreensis TaxID=1534307 RepID=A0A8T3DIW0_9TELE|nr:hypothetical protein AGOR_G00093910 [Albula goreensis]